MTGKKLTASLSLDLDNLWSYLKVHGDASWESYPSYFSRCVPIILDFLERRNQKITFFIVGKDATIDENKPWLRKLVEAGHEVGNHSLNHEPWMQNATEDEVFEELTAAEAAIEEATGQKTVGFRGPGFANSASTVNALGRLGYEYDASLLPSILGPVARLYYLSTSKMSKEERRTRGDLFGHFSDGFRPLRAFEWNTPSGGVIEMPVTTIPVFRLPFHLSYLMWLSRYSRPLARAYMHVGITMCRIRRVEPSYLLHPLDFIGAEDAPELSFFPAMDLPRERKLAMAERFFDAYQKAFDVVPMSEHVRRVKERGRLKTFEPVPVQS